MKIKTMEPTHFESLYPAASRENEIARMLTFIKEDNSCQVIGLPGGGRSNLLGLLSYNRNVRLKHLNENQKWFHFVLLNFAEVRNKPLIDAIKFLFISLADSLRERKMEEEYKIVNEIFTGSLEINDALVLFHGLKRAIEYLSLEKELTVVFLFDNFEEYIPMLTTEFFTNLRILRNLAKYRFSVVFSLNRPLEDLIERHIFMDFYEFIEGHIIYVPLYDKPVLDFRIAYIEKASGKKIDKKLLDEIIQLTAGHGKLMRFCVEVALQINNGSRIMNQEFTTLLLSQKSIQGVLFEIWNSLTPAEQNLLMSVILIPTKSGEESHGALYRASGDPSQASPDQDDSTAAYLENIGLLKNGIIPIKLLSIFIKQKPQYQIAKYHIVFDENTNEIKKGNLLLSDKLTSSEFKLLKFLLQNSNKVIEREEIINYVWANEKSTAGVTDQALDQLIFRVRKKIENDPNNPEHLQTVKGRGFRFAP